MAQRVSVLKTYKMYEGGAFIRSESGHYLEITDSKGKHIANVCRGSRKDIRNGIQATRKGVSAWSKKTAYNRGQILFRIAEMLENARDQFIDELVLCGLSRSKASNEVDASIDRIVYFAGWTDKYQQVFGSINPVASSHFNFSMPEPTGLVGISCSADGLLLDIVSRIMPVIAGGNSCIVLAPEKNPIPALSFAEIIHRSDVPAGTINIYSGITTETLPYISGHMDVNAIWLPSDLNQEAIKENALEAVENVKRVILEKEKPLSDNEFWESPYLIMNFEEIKTTWHPVGI